MKTRCAACGAVVRLRVSLRRRKRRKRRRSGDTEQQATTAALPVTPPVPPPLPEEQVVGVVELMPLAPAPPPLPVPPAPAIRPPWRHPAVWAACFLALLLVAGVLFWCARR
jgi:hypothetical protein